MFSFQGHRTKLCDGLSRREWLRVGGLGAVGLSLPQLQQARAESATQIAIDGASSFGKAKACIILFMLGGPPQHETWDPKPDAPLEIRGDIGSIATATTGLRVGELMPQTAKLTEQIAVLRAMSTGDNAHSSSGYWMLTGHPHSPKNSENALPGAPNDHPCLAAIARHLKGDQSRLPGSVRLPEEIWNTGHLVWPGQDAGWLGDHADPWLLTCDPNKADFRAPDISLPVEITPKRFEQRRELQNLMNRHFHAIDSQGVSQPVSQGVQRWSSWQNKAIDLLRSGETQNAFAIENEPEVMRDRL